MARLSTLEARGALKAPSDILTYYEAQQNGLVVRLRCSYGTYFKRRRDMPQIGRSGRVFGTNKLICHHANQTNLRDFQLLQV
jgi:hypothetical protein